ncbi:transcriptional regulator [Streptomyces sp. NPDC127098]|uniref:transcriptional regulator n=1 Tax=Streptomyces sp. NPDC127098 TaxID=3347137 RepID=UPI00365EA5D8
MDYGMSGGERVASGRNESLRKARELLNRTQEEMASDLTAFAEHLHAQGVLGERISVSPRQYRKWEGPLPAFPRPTTRTVLEKFFGVPIGKLGFVRGASTGDRRGRDLDEIAGGAADRVRLDRKEGSQDEPPATTAAVAPPEAGDPTNRRSLVALLGGTALSALASTDSVEGIRAYTRRAAATDVSNRCIEELELAVHQLGATYPAHYPSELWSITGRHRERAAQLLESRHTLSQGRQLAHQAGMLSVVLAWLAHDLGRRDLVGPLCDDAWEHGRQADSPEVCAWAEDVRCTDALYSGRPLDALTAATRGLTVAPRNGNAVVRLSAQLARAQARLGNREDFVEAARRAHGYRDHIPLHGAGLWSVDAVRIYSYDASSYGWLGEHHRAREAAERAIELYEAVPEPNKAPTRLAIARLDLALSQAALGDPEAALAVAHQALDGDRIVQSIHDRARQLGRSLLSTYPALPSVRDFGEEIRALTT